MTPSQSPPSPRSSFPPAHLWLGHPPAPESVQAGEGSGRDAREEGPSSNLEAPTRGLAVILTPKQGDKRAFSVRTSPLSFRRQQDSCH